MRKLSDAKNHTFAAIGLLRQGPRSIPGVHFYNGLVTHNRYFVHVHEYQEPLVLYVPVEAISTTSTATSYLLRVVELLHWEILDVPHNLGLFVNGISRGMFIAGAIRDVKEFQHSGI